MHITRINANLEPNVCVPLKVSNKLLGSSIHLRTRRER
jgi:hypothetical protein